MEIFAQIALRIIKEQELVIGPLAWHEASKVNGLIPHPESNQVVITGEKHDVVNRLVAQYERLFGRASREVCKEAAESLLADLPRSEVPANLQ